MIISTSLMKLFFFILLFFFLFSISCTEKKIFNFEVKKITSSEVLISTLPAINNTFEIDELGNFYLSESETSKIIKYSNNGSLVKRVGGIGKGPGEYEQGKIIGINLRENDLLAYTFGGIIINKYDINLNFVKSYAVENPLLGVDSFDNEYYLLSYYDTGKDKYIEVRDKDFNVIASKQSLIRDRNKFYRNLFLAKKTRPNEFVVVYLAINKIFRFSINGELINSFEIPGLPDLAPENEKLRDNPPKKVLFRDIIFDSHFNHLLLLEGGETNYSGSKKIHVISLNGEYQHMLELPAKVDLIATHDSTLYGLSVDSLTAKVLKFGSIE